MEFTKIVKTDLGSPHQELSNSSPFGFFRKLILCVRALGVQSSCTLGRELFPPPWNQVNLIFEKSGQPLFWSPHFKNGAQTKLKIKNPEI